VAAYLVYAYTARPLQAVGPAWNGLSLRLPENLLTAPVLFIDALRFLLVPAGFCIDHVIMPVRTVLDPRFAPAIVAVLLFLALAIVFARRAPVLAVGMGWMLLAWLPVSNAVPLLNPFAERYLYFMAPGFALLLAAALTALPHRGGAVTLAVSVVMVYAGVGIERLQDYRSDKALWQATLNQEARSARAHTWLGLEAKGAGRPEEAVRLLMRADQLNPQDVAAIINLGVMAGQQGDLDTAERLLREAVRRRPDRADARWNHALALAYQGRYGEAAKQIQAAARLDPYHPQASIMARAMHEARAHGP
jgi:tetratricopeptide (TPR) repeat protein